MQINVSTDSSPPRLVGRDEEIILAHRKRYSSAPENEAGSFERCEAGEGYRVMSGLGPCVPLQRDCNNQAALLPAMSATHAYQSRWILLQKKNS